MPLREEFKQQAMVVKKVDIPTDINLLPPESDPEKLGENVFELLERIIEDKDKRGYHKAWIENRRQLRRDTIDDEEVTRNRRHKDEIAKTSLLVKHFKRMVNSIAANNPKFDIKMEGEFGEQARHKSFQIAAAADDWYRATRQLQIFHTLVHSGECDGTSIVKMMFDFEASEFGEIISIPVDAFHFGLYPLDSVETNGPNTEAVFYFYPKEVRHLKRIFPKVAKFIEPDENLIDKITPELLENGSNGAFGGLQLKLGGLFDNLANKIGTKQTKGESVEPRTLVCEVWVKDYTKQKVTYKIVQPDGSAVVEVVEEDKYPGNIRVVTVCSGGTVVLSDKPNPNINPMIPDLYKRSSYLFNRFPFFSAGATLDPHHFWKQSDLYRLRPQQVQINKAISRVNAQAKRSIFGKIVIPKSSGITPDTVKSTSGILMPKDANHGIQILQPPSVDQSALNLIEVQKRILMESAGTFEMDPAHRSSGAPVGHQSLEMLKEDISLIHLDKLRSYTDLIVRMGKAWLSLAKNFYTEQRWVMYADPESKFISSFPFSREDLGGAPIRFNVVQGSTLPDSEAQKKAEYLSMAGTGLIPQEELIRVLDLPNAEALIRDMKAGKLGENLQKLALVLPQEALAQVQKVVNTEMKDLVKLQQKGQLPPIQLSPEAMKDPVMLREQLEIAKMQAEVRERSSKAQLNEEKSITQTVEQERIREGIDMDRQVLDIQRVEVTKDIDKKVKENMDVSNIGGQMAREGGPFKGSRLIGSDNKRR